MIKILQEELDCVQEGRIVVVAESYKPKINYLKSYPLIKEFDGRICSFYFTEGGGLLREIQLSEEDNKNKAVTVTLMDDWVEYEITDDLGKKHFIYIRSSESELILESIKTYKNKYGIVATLK
jgi:hypothetical protein